MEKQLDITRSAFCPHRSNIAPQRLLYAYAFEETRPYDPDSWQPGQGPEHKYFLARCSSCQDLLLYISTYSPCEPEDFHKVDLKYPSGVELDSAVPERVQTCYRDAMRIQHNSPSAYAILIRKALEAICDDRAIKKGILKSRLDELAARGEIPPKLVEMTQVLRTLGNAGAHETDSLISVYTTWTIADFFKAIVEYVYVAPSKLKRYKAGLNRTGNRA
jgi:hypothetical protein